MTEQHEPADEGPIEERDDEGGAEREAEARRDAHETAPDDVDRAKRWADEHAGHWHGATSSDGTEGRAEEE